MIKSRLTVLRKRIDRIDRRLAGLLAKRYECISKIGQYKLENNISVADPDRESEVLERVTSRIADEGASIFVSRVYSGIFDASRTVEKNEKL